MLLLCENIDAKKALDWGLVNQVVPISMLDHAVDELAKKLYHKLPECTRYTKQQLNFWRDFSWAMTIGHARDWLSLHAGSNEVVQGLNSFSNKCEIDYNSIRQQAAAPLTSFQSADKLIVCKECQKSMSETFSYCANCGNKLKTKARKK
jgi:1,4-dihydroxy-2-naphthoyl-CoA synthase